jgi:hypothetical protein
MEAIELIEINFDNSENHHPYIQKSHGIFIGNKEFSAHGVVGKYINQIVEQKLYLGYDGQIYPRFELVHKEVNPIGK